MGSKGPLAIVTPTEFRKRTSLALSSRSGTTLAMDKAYDDYYATRSQDAGNTLYWWLTEYRKQHGGAWNKCDRNAVSGGLLEYLHSSVAPKAISPGAAIALDRKAAARIENEEIPHARFGALYLLANIRLDIDIATTVIEGAGAIGGAIGAGMTTNYSEVGNAAKGMRAVEKMYGKDITAPQIAKVGTIGLKAGQTVINKLLQPGAAPLTTQAPPPPFRFMPYTEDTLNSASQGLSDLWNQNKYLGALAGAGAVAVAVPTAAVMLVADAGRLLWEGLKRAFKALGDMLMRAWRSRYDVATAQKLGLYLKKATVLAMDIIMKNAVPFLGGAIDVGTGLARTIGEACSRVASWTDRRRIRLQAGHPQEIANAIEHQMSMGICGGLVDILKGASKVAVSMFLPGLGSLVSVTMSAIEWLIKLLSRLGEQFAIDAFLLRARKFYKIEKDRAIPGEDGRGQPNTAKGTLITDTKAFTSFFQEGCNASPLIPMLTLNSGLAGSLMTMIKLFDDNGTQSTRLSGGRKEFDIGNDYFTRLKRYSVEYMRKSGFKFAPLTSGDKSIAGYLTHAQGTGKERQSHVAAGTWVGRLEAVARAA
jgi:hypothetical protein